MSPWILAPAWIGLAALLVASLAAREPVHLLRRAAGATEDERIRVIHRGLVGHLAATLACAGAVVGFPLLGDRGLALFLVLLFLLRALGLSLSKIRPRFVRYLIPLIAPMEGAALLIDWLLSGMVAGAAVAGHGRAIQPGPYERVMELNRKTVEQVMIPRSEIAALRADAGLGVIQEMLRRRPHSRYPVFEGDFERLTGTLEIRDLIGMIPEHATAADLARPVELVPETMACADLLDQMHRKRFDTAVVVDEFGGIAGLVTLEDLLEVMVGDLAGEVETKQDRVRREAGGSYLVEAALRVDEFNNLFQVDLPKGDYETLAGLFLSHAAHIPNAGERCESGGIRLEVVEADSRRIRTLRVWLPVSRETEDKGKRGQAGLQNP